MALAKSLHGGAGPAHRAPNVDNALPPLQLTMPCTWNLPGTPPTLTVNPLVVAEIHAEPWKAIWGTNDDGFQVRTAALFSRLRLTYLQEAEEYVADIEASPQLYKRALELSAGSTSLGSDFLHFRTLEGLPSVALD